MFPQERTGKIFDDSFTTNKGLTDGKLFVSSGGLQRWFLRFGNVLWGVINSILSLPKLTLEVEAYVYSHS